MTAKEFIYSLQEKVAADQLIDKSTRFHFKIDGAEGGDFTLVIRDETLQIEEGLQGEARCEVKATAENFMKVVNKEINPLQALLFGKVKVSNQSELVKYAKLLGLMG